MKKLDHIYYEVISIISLALGIFCPGFLYLFFHTVFPNAIFLQKFSLLSSLLVFISLYIWSFIMGRRSKKQRIAMEEDSKEKLLLKYAEKQGGVVKAANVAMLLGISKSEVEAYVVDLIKQSRPISFEIDNNGEFVFYFDLPKVRVAPVTEEFIEEEDIFNSEQLRQQR